MPSLAEFVIDPLQILERSIIFYGASDTGKSTITLDIMFNLRNYFDQVIVCSANEDTNNTYSGIAPKAFIHKKLTKELLAEIWERQEMLVSVYKRVRNQERLSAMFNLLNLPHVQAKLREVRALLESALRSIESTTENKIKLEEKREQMRSSYEDFFIKTYIKYINENREYLEGILKDPEDKYILKYLNINPRLLFVVDDCVEDIKKLKNDETLNNMFVAGRHKMVTFMMLFQDDTNLPSNLRKNAFFSVFTTQQCANALFNRSSNSYAKDLKLRADAACQQAFSADFQNQKLIYSRKKDMFYKFTATRHKGFRIGAPCMWEYSDSISTKGNLVNTKNAYFGLFKE